MLFKSKTVVAHSGEFHADDVFAVAVLDAHIGDRSKFKIIRTREQAVIDTGDYVVDVGGIYDPEKNRFDHHQIGGAGMRENGIPYASFGLVWKKYGEKIAGSKVVADYVDEKLVQPIDALDNGVSISTEVIANVRPFGISAAIGSMNVNWDETDSPDKRFMAALDMAFIVLMREIKSARSLFAAEKYVIEAYELAQDKRLIVLDKDLPWDNFIEKFPEPLYVVSPKEEGWRIKAVRVNSHSFQNRKNMPSSWAGKRDVELAAITGVHDAVFCHNKRFVAAARSKEGALKLAKIALEA